MTWLKSVCSEQMLHCVFLLCHVSWPHRLLDVYAVYQVVDLFLMDYEGFILLPVPVYLLRELRSWRTTSLAAKE